MLTVMRTKGEGAVKTTLERAQARYGELTMARAVAFVPACNAVEALSRLVNVGPGDRIVAFMDDFEGPLRDAFATGDLRLLDTPAADAFVSASSGHAPSYGDDASARLVWFVNSIGGNGLRVPDLRGLGRAARSCGALLVVDNTVASYYGCRPLQLGAGLSLEAMDRLCGGQAPRKLVAVSVARSQLKRHRVDAMAEAAWRLFEDALPALEAISDDESSLIEASLEISSMRMQMHIDRARALAEYLAANEAVPSVSYPGLASHPDHLVASGVLMHGFGPAIDFVLPEGLSAGEAIDALPDGFRTSPAGGRVTRVSPLFGRDGRALRLFAGIDDPLQTASELDRVLRARR